MKLKLLISAFLITIFNVGFAQKIALKNKANARNGGNNSVMQLTGGITASTYYVAGRENTIKLVLTLTNTDYEYGDSLAITLPNGFSIISVSPNDSIGFAFDPTNTSACPDASKSGKAEPFNGIFGQTISWGDNDNCYGGIEDGNNGTTYTIEIKANVDISVSGPQVIDYFISGDTWNNQGATVAGDLTGFLTLNECPSPITNTVNYSFCTGGNVNINGTIVSTAGTYVDTLLAVNGCDSIVTYNVTETVKPSLNITASTDTVCANGEVILSGSGAANLSWNNGITNDLGFYPSTSMYYTLTGFETAGCEAKDSIYIFVKPNPSNLTAYVSQTLPVCAGTTITYTASADSYIKVNLNGTEVMMPTVVTSSFGSPLPSNIVTAAAELVNDGTPVLYNACESVTNILTGKVAIIERGTCNFVTKCLNAQTAGAIAVIVVNNAATAIFPMAGTDPNITIPCMMVSQTEGADIISLLQLGDPVIISYGGTASSPAYTWLKDGIETVNGPQYTDAPTATHSLTLNANLNGCTASVNYTNPINPAYHDTLNTTICQGDSVWAAGDFQISSGTYYDSLTTTFGCDSITVTYLNVLPPTEIPTVSVSASENIICLGNTVTLTATGADQYSWTHNGALTDVISETPTQTTTYIVYGIDASSQCRDTAMVTITTKLNPTNLIGYVDQSLPVCAGTTITHSASSDSYIQVNNNGNISTVAAVVTTNFGSALPANLTGNAAILADDATGVTYDACEPLVNSLDLTGKIAIIQRGTCSFDVKCLNAQNAGAVAVIVINNQPAAPISMGVSGNVDASLITIPCMMISQADGAAIIASLQNTQNVSVNYGGNASSPTYTFYFTENGNTTTVNGNDVAYAPNGNYDLTIVADLDGCTNSVSYVNPINPEYNDTINVQNCIGSTYVFAGQNITTDGTYYDSSFVALTGCDSVTVLNISFTNQITNTVNAEICNGSAYEFDGNFLTATGQYNATFISNGGCDSVVTLNLNVLSPNQSPSVSIQATETSVCEGNSVTLTAIGANNYTWLNQNNNTDILDVTVNSTSTYQVVGYNDYLKCADTASITLNSKPLPSNFIAYVDVTFPICAGTPVTHTAGADGLVTVNINGGNDYQIKGVHTSQFGSALPAVETSYTAALADDQTGVTYDACELVTNDLTGKIAVIQRGSCNFTLKCLNAQTAGAVAVLVVNNQATAPVVMAGNDPSIIIPCLMVGQSDGNTIIAALNNNDPVNITIGGASNSPSFTWVISEDNGATANSNNNPFVYTPTSNYSLGVTADLNGCTSSLNYYNTVNPVLRDSITLEACSGTTVIVGSLNITADGEYIDTLQSAQGCDSIIVAQVSFVNALVTNLSASICDNDSYLFDGVSLTTAGQYSDTLTAAAGCDSVVVLNLTVNPTNAESISKSICEGDFYPFGSQNPNTAGIYTETFVNMFGCDSTVTLKLDIIPASYDTIDAAICDGDSYSFFNQTLYVAGTYNHTLLNAAGCDSVITLNLNVNPSYFLQTTAHICENDSYTFNGSTYLGTDGDVMSVWQNISVNGCDSTIRLDLYVHPVYNNTLNVQVCAGSSYMFNGNAITTDGQYTDNDQSVWGCDSITTLNITFVNTIENNISASICEGATYAFGGNNLSTAGEYRDTVTAAFGCDSIVILNLNVNPVYNIDTVKSICEGSTYNFGTQAITDAGVYTEVFSSLSGCDSTVTLTVTVNPLPVVNIVAAMDTVCDNGGIIALNGSPNGHNGFEWYWGNGVVDSTFNPSGLSGSQDIYYGILDANGCYNEDTTSVYVEICTGISVSYANRVSVNPNPFKNNLKVELGNGGIASVIITDVTGRTVITQNIKGNSVINTENLIKGIYFVNINLNNEVSTFKVIKQ